MGAPGGAALARGRLAAARGLCGRHRSTRPHAALPRAARVADQSDTRGVGGAGASSHGEQVSVSMSNHCATTSKTDFVAETKLPTDSGFYRLRAYRHSVEGVQTMEPLAIICGDVEGLAEVPLRVHDACFTSEVLGSLKCDCKQQFDLALEYIRTNGPGLMVYLQQEGRGIGLANKIAAYALQEDGLDTVDANRALGLPDDTREYSSIQAILQDLNVSSVKLITNNPRKIEELKQCGVDITDRIPCIAKANLFNENYLRTKESRMRHFRENEDMEGQWCFRDHGGDLSGSHDEESD